jgi:hypothetical protein
VADLDTVAEAIRTSPFVQGEGWLSLAALLGGKNRLGEVYLEKLVAGAYRDNRKQRGRVRRGEIDKVESIRL